jgi:hypothetical protein
MPNVKPVLIVAGEGGGIKMVQEEGGQGRFRVFMADQTPTFLDDSGGGGPALHRDSGWLPTWEAAVAYFSKWPWPMLVPRKVDPRFAHRVLTALTEVAREKSLTIRSYRMQEWHKICSPDENAP